VRSFISVALFVFMGCSSKTKSAETETPAVQGPVTPKAPTTSEKPAAWSQADLKVGTPVDSKFEGTWYHATITKVHPEGTYDVRYKSDGLMEWKVAFSKLRAPEHIPAEDDPQPRQQPAKPSVGGADAPCPGPGLTRRCNGVCVNLQTDSRNCGSCGHVCQSGYTCDGHLSCRDAAGNL
jgi:hypothetical protein